MTLHLDLWVKSQLTLSLGHSILPWSVGWWWPPFQRNYSVFPCSLVQGGPWRKSKRKSWLLMLIAKFSDQRECFHWWAEQSSFNSWTPLNLWGQVPAQKGCLKWREREGQGPSWTVWDSVCLLTRLCVLVWGEFWGRKETEKGKVGKKIKSEKSNAPHQFKITAFPPSPFSYQWLLKFIENQLAFGS